MKICIVGGGSAGWMTASTLIKAYPDWDITLVESPNVPTVGVGESTTQFFRHWLHFLGLRDEEWMPHCDATYKLSVRFHNFHKIGDDPWQYPFGNPRSICTPDVWFYNAYRYKWSYAKFATDYWMSAKCADENLLPVSTPDFNIKTQSGFHFDAVKFANWLRDNYATPRGVKHILKHVDKSILEEDYDLFFDCTGFKSLLNDSEWIDYSEYLPNNRAWVTRKQYVDPVNEMVPVTDCTALSSGWVWNVPTWGRIGTGYNFCNKYITEEDALQEFIQYLDVDDNQKFRLVEYKTGRKKEVWNGKVISIGLSAGFIEPLESNGLLSVHQFLLFFTRVMSDRTVVTQYMRDTFNHGCSASFDVFASFVALHYALTQRNDSKYWNAVRNIRYPDNGLLYLMKDTFMSPTETFNTQISFGQSEGMITVMAGHGWNPFNDTVMDEIEFYNGTRPNPPDSLYETPWTGIDSLPRPYDYYKRKLYAD
jgi:tryptophan halogenase